MHVLGLPFSTAFLPRLLLRALLTLQALNIFVFKVIDPALRHKMCVANVGWKI